MENSFSSLSLELQTQEIALPEYVEYLSLALDKNLEALSNELKKQQFLLIEVLHCLSSPPPEKNTNSPTDPMWPHWIKIENIGIQLLVENRISLSEINAILCQTPLGQLKFFLHQLLKQRKIRTDDFLNFLRDPTYESPKRIESPYTLRTSPTLEFYVSLEHKNKIYGAYHVLEEIGRGGMGVVYKGYHPHLNRIVALKVLLSGNNADEEEIQRFHREIEIMAQLQHEKIVQIYDAGVQENERYLAMEHIEGDSLGFLSSTLTLREKVCIIRDTLLGLEYAHQKGIIHRDLKLENILVLPTLQPKIADFGLARLLNDEQQKKITSSGVILGTANYMAPEQARGKQKEIDAQTDIYSIGVCLYRLLTNHYPFEAETLPYLLVRIVKDEPTPPSKYLPSLQKDLERILLKSIEKEKKNRYRSAKDFAEDLTKFLEAVPITPENYWLQWKKRIQRHKVLVFLALFFFFCVLYTQGIRWQEKKELLTQKIEEAFQKENFFLQEQTNIYLGLQTWASLNQALRLQKNNKKLLQKKWDTGELLLQQTLKNKEYQLGDYLIQEMQQIDFISPEKRRLRYKEWQKQKNKKGQQEKKQFEKWLSLLNSSPFEDPLGKEALYEIAKMSNPIVPKKLLNLLHEGNLFFTNGAFTEHREKTKFYSWVVRLLKKMNIIEAMPLVLEGLSNIVEKQSQYKSGKQDLDAINYLFELVKYLIEMKAHSQTDFLLELQVAMGENSLYATRTAPLLKKLFQQKLSLQKKQIWQTATEYFLSGKQRHLAGDLQEAILDFNEAIRLRPKFAEAFYFRGVTQIEAHHFDSAIKDLHEAIRLYPQEAKAYHQRGIAKHHQQHFEEAILDFDEAIRLNSQFAEAFYWRGKSQQEKQNLELAIQDFSQAIQIHPQFIEAFYWRGNAKKENNDFEGAILDFEETLRLNPRFARAYSSRGEIKQSQKDFEGALQDFSEALEINPQFAEAYYSRGTIKGEIKDFEGAIADYLEAIRLNPHFKLPHIHTAKEKEKKNADRVIEHYTETVRLTPEHAEAYFHRGCAKYYQMQMEEAILDFTEAIRLHPKFADAYFYRGYAKYYQQDLSGAIFDFSETIRLHPQFAEAYFYRGYILWNEKHLAKDTVKKDFSQFIQLITQQQKTFLYSQQLDWIYQEFPELKTE